MGAQPTMNAISTGSRTEEERVPTAAGEVQQGGSEPQQVPFMKHKSGVTPVNTLEDETKTEEGLSVDRKRTKISGSVKAHEGFKCCDIAKKAPDDLPPRVSAYKEPKLINCALQSSGNESAMSRLPKICTASGWKAPSYDFEERGPPHNKLFRCKVTIYVETIVDTIMECFSDFKPQKKAAQEHAAQGALWCLKHFGHVK